MGQAQLLLIVLGVVLVGIAIIAGIQAYDTNNKKASLDAQVHDLVRMASDTQVWAQKPVQFGGPATYSDMTNANFTVIGYDGDSDTQFTNSNAVYTWAAGATPTISGLNDDLDTYSVVIICGIQDTDILTAVAQGAAPTTPTCPT